MLGDQVYADEVSPETLAFIRKRRDTRKPPGEEVADFEEYTRLYRESWEDPHIRWLLSTVSISMVIDDHDVHDDWNISAAWVEDMRELDWWAERECAGLASYWLYQFIGNLSPKLLRESDLLARVRPPTTAGRCSRVRGERARRARRGALELLPRPRFDPADRDRLPDRPRARRGPALDAQRRGVGVAGAAPARRLRAPADRHVRPAGARARAPSRRALGRGGRRRRLGGGRGAPAEKLRRTADLDHWAAFGDSFDRLTGLLGARRRRASSARRRPRSRCSRATFTTRIWRSSPTRAPRAFAATSGRRSARRFATRSTTASARRSTSATRGSRRAVFSGLARLAGAPRERVRWRLVEGPFYDNQVATLTLDGRSARLRLERTIGDPETDHRELHTSFERSLT